MIAYPTGARRADEALRVVRALGGHRYVGGRLHLVHALAFATVPDDGVDADVLREPRAWAEQTLAAPALDAASRDERLWRRSTEAEIAAVLSAFWAPVERAAVARASLRKRLTELELPLPEHAPFDEAFEEATHPLLIDAGWELLALSTLDPARHRGAMDAFGHALAYESACFEEETAIPPVTHLYELPALGPAELLMGTSDEGELKAPLVVWVDGDPTYLDYVMRGVRRAAKLPERDPDDPQADDG
jgi:hypothetical protein